MYSKLSPVVRYNEQLSARTFGRYVNMYYPRKIMFLSGNMIFPKGVNLHISLAIMQ